jgi:hypothetical protein
MLPREAFIVGFLTRCADEALTGSEVRARIEKVACLIEKRAFSWGDTALGGAGWLGNAGLFSAVAAPVALGVGGGYLAHKATEDSITEEDFQKKELISELHRWARRAREQKRMRSLVPA